MLATPGLTALSEPQLAREVLLEDALRALPAVRSTQGAVVDVGSGGGSPGLPLAVALPDRRVTLLEAERRKCEFLHRYAEELPNVEVVRGRAEEHALEAYGVALAKALAKPPVAAELILPLVRQGGIGILWTGRSADLGAVERAAGELAAEVEREDRGLVVLRKTGPTPARFPRKPGLAKKRPLA